MNVIQVYIGGERIDLFKDESITIVESIKNAKDISKVFTTFTKQFTVPASKNNNRIFKHYYNYHIVNGFDARKKNAASIEIDGIPFRNGRLKLDGVDMKNNSPYAYRVTFYGSVVELKDILGEDKLPSLSSDTDPKLLNIDKAYNATALKGGLVTPYSPTGDGTVLPLITHSQRLYYDSEVESEQSGNLYYGTKTQGVKYDQLKYAVNLNKIIDSIETKYSGINFTSDCFFRDTNYDFGDLFMWCHRNKGDKEIASGTEITVPFIDQSEPTKFTSITNNIATINQPNAESIYVEFIPDSSDYIYDIVLYRKPSGGSVFEEIEWSYGVSGTRTLGSLVPSALLQSGDQFYVSVKTYEDAVLFNQIELRFTQTGGEVDDYFLFALQVGSGFSFNIAENMPEMKIIDFLSNLFKMFNLVAYVQDDGKIQIKTLDDFYTSNEIDITRYVDFSSSQVDVALPYKEIFFKYSDTGTILAQQHYQEIAQVIDGKGPFEWGGVEYTDAADLSGDTYKVEPAFHHAKYENLIDNSNPNNITGVQYGYFVTDNEEAYLGQPLIMYVNAVASGTDIGFLSRNDRTKIAGTQTINMPSNLNTIDDNTSENIHFNTEKSEYDFLDAENTLFSRFYKSYIENIFNPATRLIKVTTMLPVGKLIQLNLSDIVVLRGNKYRINSYSANISTGKTEIELINYYV